MPNERIYFIFLSALPLFMPMRNLRHGIARSPCLRMATLRTSSGLQAMVTTPPATQAQD